MSEHQTPAEAGQRWLAATPEAQRHNAVCDRLARLERLVGWLVNRFGGEVEDAEV